MNTKRVSYLMIGVLAALVLAILGSTYLATGMLAKQARTLNDLKLKSEVLTSEQTSLIKAKSDVAKYSTLEDIAKKIVPQDKNQATAIREIVKLAAESGIRPSSITFPSSDLGTAASAAGAAASAPAAGADAKNKLSQLIPVKGNPGLYLLQITITQDPGNPVPYSRFIDFLSRLEQNRRTAQVSNIVLQPTASDPGMLSFTLTVDQYIKP